MMIEFFRRPQLSPLLAFSAALLLFGCGEPPANAPSPKSGKGGKGGGVAPVLVGQSQLKVVPLVIEAIGAVEPIRTTAIRSQVTGILTKISIQEGQDVQVGDLLFEIDARPFKNAVRSAEADLQKAKVQLETARAQVARYRTLTTDQMVSKEQFEKIADTARALEAEVLSDESRLATAKLQVEFCSIRAPLSGRTGNMTIHEGDLVRANEAGGLLVTINQISPIYTTFAVPQVYLATLTRYRANGSLKVIVVPPGADEKPEAGELTFMDNTVDASTGTLKLKAAFPNREHRLWPGQFATVTVTLANPEALTVPSSAIQTSQKGQYVYVVRTDQTAELRPVIVERHYSADAVISRGLKVGETVITEGHLRVIPDKPVANKGAAGSSPEATPSKSGKGSKKGEGKSKSGETDKKSP